MLDRTDRSLIGIWWWTVDRWLLTIILMLMVLGTILVMAASPPVAVRLNLPEQHFVWRQLIFLLPAVCMILFFSMISPRQIRIISLLGLFAAIGMMIITDLIGNEVNGATRWVAIGRSEYSHLNLLNLFLLLFALGCLHFGAMARISLAGFGQLVLLLF